MSVRSLSKKPDYSLFITVGIGFLRYEDVKKGKNRNFRNRVVNNEREASPVHPLNPYNGRYANI